MQGTSLKKWHEFFTAKGFVENVCKIYELINNLLHSEENLKLLDFHRLATTALRASAARSGSEG